MTDASPRRTLRLTGKVLYLTEDMDQLKGQLDGALHLSHDPQRKLIDNISTDELTPGWVCYYYDATLARYCLVGLRGGVVQKDSIKNGGFQVIVSGRSNPRGRRRLTRSWAPGSSWLWPRTSRRSTGRTPRTSGC
ncbi:MAG: hypothetical protein MUF64_14725 [Polyangiaceae bacterium]|nr:hypothetical protein [Polyangiaceae bacterium]